MAIYMSGEREDGSRDCFLSGRVTKDAKFEYTKVKGTPKATFSVAYGQKKYMNVASIGESPVTSTAACLESGDTVFVAGKYSSRKYTGRDGTDKEWREVLADLILLQTAPPSTNYGPPEGGTDAPEVQSAFHELEGDDGELPF